MNFGRAVCWLICREHGCDEAEFEKVWEAVKKYPVTYDFLDAVQGHLPPR
jgi:hypothetical protein